MGKALVISFCPNLGKLYINVKFEHFYYFSNKNRKNFQNVYGSYSNCDIFWILSANYQTDFDFKIMNKSPEETSSRSFPFTYNKILVQKKVFIYIFY